MRGKVTVIASQRMLTDTMFAVMQYLHCGSVCVFKFIWYSRRNWFCAVITVTEEEETRKHIHLLELSVNLSVSLKGIFSNAFITFSLTVTQKDKYHINQSQASVCGCTCNKLSDCRTCFKHVFLT